MITIVEKELHEEPYTKEEVMRELDTTSDHLNDMSLTQNTRHIETFKLRQRALHVFRGKCLKFLFLFTQRKASSGPSV